jgi:hypothetical protein
VSLFSHIVVLEFQVPAQVPSCEVEVPLFLCVIGLPQESASNAAGLQVMDQGGGAADEDEGREQTKE